MLRRACLGCFAIALALLALAVACAEPQRTRILTLLFDGVPDQSAAEPGTAAPSAESPPAAPPAARRPITGGPDSPHAQTVSASHASFATDCSACHGSGASVTDESCRVCHGIGDHHGDDVGIACGRCHGEHVGRGADLTAVATSHCSECHDADPFEQAHEQFSLVADADAARRAKDASGLEVFHALHMEMEVMSGPREDEPMHCYDCHALRPDGPLSFKQPTYVAACSSCHELESVHKSIPQVDWEEVRGSLPEGFDPDGVLLTDARFRELLDRYEGQPQAEALESAREQVVDAGLEECFRCHAFVDREIDGEHVVDIRPVRPPRYWFANVRFAHSAHAFMDCAGCHAVPEDQDEELGRLILPGKEVCAECHRTGAASNACSVCHTFHTRVPQYGTQEQAGRRLLDAIKSR